ncbi:uncharacterized protein LOC121874915 isoform X2 [Homarus americanus]|nr:uncharacterized protein LOC121874915 isoform X2 [Homarus americanus]XP_042235194.1 uncharacterized protein LOC121874915 isoform X2 [Homarus americanus]
MGSFVSWLLLGLLTTPSFSLGNTAFFTKVYVDGGDAPCATTNTLYLTKEFTHAREIYCPFRCAQDPSCTLCTFTDGQCKLYTLKLTPNVACAVSGRGTVGYSRLPKDLALYKHVDYSSMVTDHIGIFSEITNDATSWQSFTYCPCTTNQGSEWVRVDLEKTYLVSSILLTASADVRETYFKTVKIHVGNTGDVHYDPVVAVKSAATPSPYQVLQYDVAARGRFVTLHQQEVGYFCLCKVQVF